MNLAALRSELDTDPLTRGYSGMSDEQAAESLNVVDRQADRDTISGGMIAASMIVSELAALNATQRQIVQTYISAGDMPLTPTLKTELGNIFAAGTQTRANLIALVKREGSRAEELNLGERVTPSHVADARRLP